MARTKDDPDQYLDGFRYYSLGVRTGSGIAMRLAKDYGDRAKPDRTVRSWIPKYEALLEKTVNVDEPFEWHRMEEYGLPWEAGVILLRVWQLFVVRQMFSEDLSNLTVRQAKWCWRIHCAAPAITEPLDLLDVAIAFAGRELRRDVLAEPLVMDDLEAWLAFQPWAGYSTESKIKPVSARMYEDAIEKGLIPKLNAANPHTLKALWKSAQELADHEGWALEKALREMGGLSWPRDVPGEEPWVLPSQALEIFSRLFGEQQVMQASADKEERDGQ